MTKGKRQARRLALYLSSIDIPLPLQPAATSNGQRFCKRNTTHSTQGSESWREQPDVDSSERQRPWQTLFPLSRSRCFDSPRKAHRLSSPERDPERSDANTSPGGGRRSHLPAPPAGWEAVFQSAPGPVLNGPRRFGRDSRIATRCASTSARLSQGSGIWGTFAGCLCCHLG
jgi:hypothetical protein